MTLSKLYQCAPGGTYYVNYYTDYENLKVESFIGTFVGEISGEESYYVFVTKDREIKYVDKWSPFDYFGGKIPDNYRDTMAQEIPAYHEPLREYKITTEETIEAFRSFYLYLVKNNNEDYEIEDAYDMLVAVKRSY